MTDRRPTLLAIDDEPAMLAIVERFAQGLDYRVACHSAGRGALAQIADLRPDVVLVDLLMPEMSGLEVLRAIRRIEPGCAVVLMTGHASVDSAIEAVRLGALDYLTKPLDLDRLRGLLATVRKNIEHREEALLDIDADVAERFDFHGMIGRSPAMEELFDTIRRLAPHARAVLIVGETGTGKELVARAFHELGPRRHQRFVTINCSAVVATLFESELFGHQRGAFTGASEPKTGMFEHADGGTLFLDEVGELPMSVQPKLLRAVEYGELQRVGAIEARRVDVHVVGATNCNLRQASARGQFRSDLYYRLALLEVRVPALRERREDIPLLTASFIRHCAVRLNRPITGVTTAAERLLQQSDWAGNVRELRNVVELACLLSEARMLTDRDVHDALKASGAYGTAPAPRTGDRAETGGADRLANVQRVQIDRVLERVGGNKTAAARLLGISRRALHRRLARRKAANDNRPAPGE